MLKLRVQITNNSSKSSKFQEQHPFPYLGEGSWKISISKDGIKCGWDYNMFVTYEIKEFKVKPGKTVIKDLYCELDDMKVGGNKYTAGEYSAIVELRSVNSGNFSQAVKSNSQLFSIQ